jgi:hypothetical protein
MAGNLRLPKAHGNPYRKCSANNAWSPKDYLEWHYPPGPVELTHDAQGQPRFTVAGTTVVVTAYSDPDRRVNSGDTTDEDVLTTPVRP